MAVLVRLRWLVVPGYLVLCGGLLYAVGDRLGLDIYRLERERMSKLVADKAITQKALDEAQQTLRAAEAAQREVAAQIVSAQAVVEEKTAAIAKARADRDSAVARSQVAAADRQRTETLLQYATIRAPFDGVIAQRNVDTGHFVTAGNSTGRPLLVVVRTDLLRVFVDIPETDAPTVETGSEAKLRVPAAPGEGRPGNRERP